MSDTPLMDPAECRYRTMAALLIRAVALQEDGKRAGERGDSIEYFALFAQATSLVMFAQEIYPTPEGKQAVTRLCAAYVEGISMLRRLAGLSQEMRN